MTYITEFDTWSEIYAGGLLSPEFYPKNAGAWIKSFHYIRANNGTWEKQETFIKQTDLGTEIKILCGGEWHYLLINKERTKITSLNHPEGFEAEAIVEGMGGKSLPCFLCMKRLQSNIDANEAMKSIDCSSFEVSGFDDDNPKINVKVTFSNKNNS